MNDIIPDVDRWRKAGQDIALATVVSTWGSAPRAAGAKMALTASGEISGSVSGGCVEGAVVESGIGVLRTRLPELLHFGVADETAWEVGLACGGTIEVFVQPLEVSTYERLHQAIEDEELISRLSFIRGPVPLLGRELLVLSDGSIETALPERMIPRLRELATRELQTDSSRPRASRHSLKIEQVSEEVEVLVEIFPPPPSLVIVGGVHIAVVLVSLANSLGYRTIVIDPRRAFGSESRFEHADRLYQAWPQEAFSKIGINSSTAVAMLTHDPKIDDPALHIALDSEAFFIGALGSEKTQQKRRRRLRQAGIPEEKIQRIRGPIGLPLGGRNPEEIALAIMAEIVAARNKSLD